MPRITIVYGVLDENEGRFSVSFPDAPKVTGYGTSREAAIEKGAQLMRKHVAAMERDGKAFAPRTTKQLSYDDAVRVALQLGMEMVAVPL